MSKSVVLRKILMAALIAAVCVPLSMQAQKGAGAFITGDAKAKDAGLPEYPGSKPYHEKSDDSPAANMGLWAGGSGFQLIIVKFQSQDSPEKIAGYYRKALSKYGQVLDCSHPQNATDQKQSPNALTCGDDKPDSGGMLFKSGSKDVQHMVAIRPEGSGTVYTLLYLVAKDKGHEAEL